eukprot:GHVU01128512.1.p1 GENE.GHVU01128512.1~~GHVU01128512.1.p1  ORF type:complete len:172 (+),score=7.75 GHVU01128512.1:431-946(+)
MDRSIRGSRAVVQMYAWARTPVISFVWWLQPWWVCSVEGVHGKCRCVSPSLTAIHPSNALSARSVVHSFALYIRRSPPAVPSFSFSHSRSPPSFHHSSTHTIVFSFPPSSSSPFVFLEFSGLSLLPPPPPRLVGRDQSDHDDESMIASSPSVADWLFACVCVGTVCVQMRV